MQFINQVIQTVQQFPILSQTQELRQIYQVNQQLVKPLGNRRLDTSFWNNDITKQEIEISKILHQIGYHYSPDPVHQFKHEKLVRVSLTLEEYRQELLEFFEDRASHLYLQMKYAQRHSITPIPQKDLPFYEPLYEIDQQKQENVQKYIDQIRQYHDLCEKLSNERIIENREQEIPQIQISADDDVIFERINNRILTCMPFITKQHLKEYYQFKQSSYVQQIDDLETQIYIESLQVEDHFLVENIPNFKIPVTMPSLHEEVQIIADQQKIEQDINVDNGALFLFAIDKHFAKKIQDQSQQYMMFLPYNLEIQDQKTKNFQQQTQQILNEMKEEAIKKKQYRIRSTAHWIDGIKIDANQRHSEVDLIINQYEDTIINSWMKFLLFHESDKILDKLQKDISLIQEGQPKYPEIYFQFYHRYQKLIYLDSRQSIISIMHSLNVMRTMQKNLNIYFVDLNNLKNSNTKERIQKRTNLNLSAFVTNLQSPETESPATSPYLLEEAISYQNGLFEVIDANGYKILNEVIFKDLYEIQDRISHLSAFTLQFTLKIAEISNQSNMEQFNRQKVVKELLNYEAQFQEAKCRVLQIVFPLLKDANVNNLSNAICVLSQMIKSLPQFEYKQNVIGCYQREIKRLQLLAQIFQHTQNLSLILKIFQIRNISTLIMTHKHIKRDKLIDTPFPFKFLYQDPILDVNDNLNLILKVLPQDGNFNIMSILQFIKYRRKVFKYCLRIYYNSQIYIQQIIDKYDLQKVINQLEIIPNRTITTDNIDIYDIILNEYVNVGKECLLLQNWQGIVQENYRLVDYLIVLKSLVQIDFYLFNTIQINKLQNVQFVDIIALKEKLSYQAQNNNRKSIQSLAQQQQQQDQVEQKKQQAIGILSQQFRGTMLVKNFINKIQTNQSSILQEFNQLMGQQCYSIALCHQALIQRQEQINMNEKLPFVKHIFQLDGELLDQNLQIKNPFAIASLKQIMGILNYKEIEIARKAENKIDEDWYTTQKLKIEKNISTLMPNKKQTKFKGAGNPFSSVCKLNEPITAAQQMSLQLIWMLLGLHFPNCNIHDIIYYNNDLLHVEELKRNLLRFRRDLEGVTLLLDKIKANISKILVSKEVQNINQAVFTYMFKLIKRYNLISLITMISAVHQFRSQMQDDEQIYGELIKTLQQTLCMYHFRNINYVEKIDGEAPRVYPSIQTKNLQSEKQMFLQFLFADQFMPVYQTNPSNQLRPMRQLQFSDFYTQMSPYMMPTHQVQLRNNKITFNVASFYSNIICIAPQAMGSLFTGFQQSKLIYYSTIQELLISETESILRNKCIFEVDDIFKYEKGYRKILLIQLRYLILSEFFVNQKANILPFDTTQQDPCTQFLEQAVALSQQHTHKQALKAGILLNLGGLGMQFTKAIQDINHKNPKSFLQNEKYNILPRLRIDTFENQIFQLVTMMIGSQGILLQEGVEHYKQLNKKITQKDQDYQVANQLSVFYSNFERDSLRIKTLNKGEAHVIADSDLERHINELNARMLLEIQSRYPHNIKTENDTLKQIYNQKSLELQYALKKLKFYETNINHIVESLVAQRTNDLIFENDSLKQEIENNIKLFEIQKDQLRDEIKQQYDDKVKSLNGEIQFLNNRFNDFKKGMSMELTNFISEYKQDGLKRIRDRASEILFGQQNKINIDLDLEFQRIGVYEKFQEESKQISELLQIVQQMRVFYKFKEGCIREKYEKKIQLILSSNSSNEELQQKIQELSEKIEVLKDELISNRKIITIMDNQNQILRRDLQKFKVERFQAMREKGQIGAVAQYQDSEQIQKKERPITSHSVRKIKTPLSSTQKVPTIQSQTNILKMKYKITQI